jgi:hypothetical protein
MQQKRGQPTIVDVMSPSISMVEEERSKECRHYAIPKLETTTCNIWADGVPRVWTDVKRKNETGELLGSNFHGPKRPCPGKLEIEP